MEAFLIGIAVGTVVGLVTGAVAGVLIFLCWAFKDWGRGFQFDRLF